MAKQRSKQRRLKVPTGEDLVRHVISSLADRLMSDARFAIGDSDPAKDLLFLEKNAFPDLAPRIVLEAELDLDFPPKIQLLQLTGSDEGPGWAPSLVEPGDPSFMAGGIEGLRKRMDGAMKYVQAPRVVALWVCPYPPGGGDSSQPCACVFARHSAGFEQVYLAGSRGFMRIPSDEHLRHSTLETMLEHYPMYEDRLAQVQDELEGSLVKARREIEAKFEECRLPAPNLTDAQWTLLMRSAVQREEWSRAVEELCQQAARSGICQATNLAGIAVSMDKGLEEAASQSAQDADLSRDKQFRKLRADLEKAELVTRGAVERARRAEEEMQLLRRAQSAQRAHPAPLPAKDTLGDALAALFS